MKKFLKFVGYSFLFLFVLGVIGAIISPDEEVQEKKEEKTEEVASNTNDKESKVKEEKPVVKKEKPLVKEEPKVDPKEEKKKEIEAALKDIFSQAESSLNDTVSAYNEVAHLSSLAAENPIMMLQNEWKFSMGVQFGILKASGRTFKNVSSDSKHPEVQEIVSMYHQLGDKMIQASDVSVQGIDNVDGDTINRGANLTHEANDIANEITKKVNDLKSEYGF